MASEAKAAPAAGPGFVQRGAEEVYETKDVEPRAGAGAAAAAQPRDASDQIDNSPLAPGAAFAAFASAAPQPLGVRQSDSAAPMVLATGGGAREAPMDRFRRLRREIDELEADLGAMAAQGAGLGFQGLPADVAALQQQLAQLEPAAAAAAAVPAAAASSERLLAAVSSLSSSSAQSQPGGDVAYEVLCAPGGAEERGALAEAEARLARLEAAVGPAGARAEAGGLLAAVAGLEERLGALDSAHLAALSRRAQPLAEELRGLSSSSSSSSGGVTADRRVDEAHELLTRWDAVVADVPRVAERLAQLDALHAQAAQFAARLGRLEGDQEGAEATLRDTAKVLAEVQQGLQENMEVVAKNIASLG